MNITTPENSDYFQLYPLIWEYICRQQKLGHTTPKKQTEKILHTVYSPTNNIYLVAKQEDEIIGCAIATITLNQHTQQTECYLHTLLTTPAKQSLTLATKLIVEMKQAARQQHCNLLKLRLCKMDTAIYQQLINQPVWSENFTIVEKKPVLQKTNDNHANIRTAQEDDYPFIIELIAKGLVNGRSEVEKENLSHKGNKQFAQKLLKHFLDKNCLFLISEKDKKIAYATLENTFFNPYLLRVESRIHDVYVIEEALGQKVSLALHHLCENIAYQSGSPILTGSVYGYGTRKTKDILDEISVFGWQACEYNLQTCLK